MGEIHPRVFPVSREMPWKSRVTFSDDNDRIILRGQRGGKLTMRRTPLPGVVEVSLEGPGSMVECVLLDVRDIQSAAISITANGIMED